MKFFFHDVNTQNFEFSYLFANEIERFLSEKENSKTIHAIHVNIKSLSKNFDNLLDILRNSNNNFNVLCITELGARIHHLRVIKIYISQTLMLLCKKEKQISEAVVC